MAKPPTQSERVLEFTAYGIPASKGSMTPWPTSHGIVLTSANPNLAQWDMMLRIKAGEVMSGPLWEGPIDLTAVFTFARPKTVKRRYHTVKPDEDKLTRALFDSLKGIVVRDDAQIFHTDITKEYGERPGVWVSMREVGS